MSTPRPHGPVTFDELTAGLIWPKLFRALPMSLQPTRLLLGTITALVLWGVYLAVSAVFGEAFRNFIATPSSSGPFNGGILLTGDLWRATGQYWDNAIATAMGRWYTFLPSVIILAVVASVLTGALVRNAAVDAAASLSMGLVESLKFALTRWLAFAFAPAIPLLFIFVLAALIALTTVLLDISGVGVIDAILAAPTMLLSLVAVLLSVGFLFGHSMLAPAVACECTDSADAVQRVYAYILGRPGRLLLYSLVSIAVGKIAWWALASILTYTLETPFILGNARAGSPTRERWIAVATVLSYGWFISYYSCAGTLLYLLMRRVNDQQDIREIWFPGMIPGTQASESATPSQVSDEAA